jgi:uncharacterized protein YcbK (DUF882 family)
MKLTCNFSMSEFECNCGCKMPEDVKSNIIELADNLQVLRDVLNMPIKITNAFRCESKNNSVNGVKNSQHLVGKAADLQIPGIAPKEVADLVSELMEKNLFKMGGLGRYNSFTHVDIRGNKARWGLKK